MASYEATPNAVVAVISLEPRFECVAEMHTSGLIEIEHWPAWVGWPAEYKILSWINE